MFNHFRGVRTQLWSRGQFIHLTVERLGAMKGAIRQAQTKDYHNGRRVDGERHSSVGGMELALRIISSVCINHPALVSN